MTINFSDLTDSALLDRVSQGDNLAFGALYERYLDHIYRHVYYRLADHTEAEDVTEMVFLKAWQALSARKKSIKVQNFRAWLYRIAHNEVIKHYRTHKPTLTIDHATNLRDPTASLETNILAMQESQLLAQAIAQLEPNYQQVIVCRFISQLSPGEIAKIMDIQPGHVRVLQHRALKKMETLLTQEK
jgi:RNA polymerase sigma-70 factor (ECF subfamily)